MPEIRVPLPGLARASTRDPVEPGDIIEIVEDGDQEFFRSGNIAVVVKLATPIYGGCRNPACLADFNPYAGRSVDCYGDIVPDPEAPVANLYSGTSWARGAQTGWWFCGSVTGEYPELGLPYTYRLVRSAKQGEQNGYPPS